MAHCKKKIKTSAVVCVAMFFSRSLLVMSAIQLRLSAQAQSAPKPGRTGRRAEPVSKLIADPRRLWSLTLQDALERAKKLNPEYRTAVTGSRIGQRRSGAKVGAALLPSANFNGQFLYHRGRDQSGQRELDTQVLSPTMVSTSM